MCNKESMFTAVETLPTPMSAMLSDGRNLQAVGHGNVTLTMHLPKGKETCTLYDNLLVPDLAYNLLSITSAAKKGKVTIFSEMRYEIRDSKSKLIAPGYKEAVFSRRFGLALRYTKGIWVAKRAFVRQVTCAHARKPLATPILGWLNVGLWRSGLPVALLLRAPCIVNIIIDPK